MKKMVMKINNIAQNPAELAAMTRDVKLALPSVLSPISSVEYDSRLAVEGCLFVAVQGYNVDGHDFVEQAVSNGAAAVLISENRLEAFRHLAEKGCAVFTTNNTREALSEISAAFYGFPSDDMKVIGVTGTNGKTSVTYMIESVLRECGFNCGVIGTINSRWNGNEYTSLNTTPESRDIQKILRSMKEDGVEYAVMEVSSHALALDRVAHINFDCAVFTNLTGEHLDFHHDMDDYFEAKLRLFDLLEASPKKEKTAAVNIDDEYGARIFASREKYGYKINGFGLGDSADFLADAASVENRISGLSYSMLRPFAGARISLNCAGGFQLYNSLSVVSALASINIPFEAICRGLAGLRGVPGRFDVVSEGGVSAIIDYAHTGDALSKLLDSVNGVRTGKIITVFGCGGDRDKTKRPLMGKIASEKSDVAVVTSDNPRTEAPDSIIADIVAGISSKNYIVIPDRASAIREAAVMAGEGDILVIAGKGHEDYQILGKEKIHFDDREEAQKALYARSRN